MNEWVLAAAIVVIGGILPCGIVCFFAPAMEALVALELAGVLAALALMLLAEGFHRQPFADLAIVLAALSFAGAVAFARFLEREL
jgi:multisubunit Na+/H+ antiporter MnhF subunit